MRTHVNLLSQDEGYRVVNWKKIIRAPVDTRKAAAENDTLDRYRSYQAMKILHIALRENSKCIRKAVAQYVQKRNVPYYFTLFGESP